MRWMRRISRSFPTVRAWSCSISPVSNRRFAELHNSANELTKFFLLEDIVLPYSRIPKKSIVCARHDVGDQSTGNPLKKDLLYAQLAAPSEAPSPCGGSSI